MADAQPVAGATIHALTDENIELGRRLFFAVFPGDPEKISRWKDERRIGPSRARKGAAPAAPAAQPEPVTVRPAVDKAS